MSTNPPLPEKVGNAKGKPYQPHVAAGWSESIDEGKWGVGNSQQTRSLYQTVGTS